MKITAGLALGDRAGQLAQRLAHQPGLQADVRIADFAFEFLLRHQARPPSRSTITSTALRLDEHFGDLHRLFAAGWAG